MQAPVAATTTIPEVRVLNLRYRLKHRLGEGSFGVVFSGEDTAAHPPVPVAIKLEDERVARLGQLPHEFNLYRLLANAHAQHFPRVHTCQQDGQYTVLVMERMDRSLCKEASRTYQHRVPWGVLRGWAADMLTALRELHGLGYVHRDLKPENFLFRTRRRHVCLIDLGLAAPYRNEDGQHYPHTRDTHVVGTMRYAARGTHSGLGRSRQYDMESLCYVLLYLALGRLPWARLPSRQDPNYEQSYTNMVRLKNNLRPADLCAGLPWEVEAFVRYCWELDYSATPDYDYLHTLLAGTTTGHQLPGGGTSPSTVPPSSSASSTGGSQSVVPPAASSWGSLPTVDWQRTTNDLSSNTSP